MMSIFIGLPVSAVLGVIAYLAVLSIMQSSGLTLGKTYFTKQVLAGSAALLSIALSGLASLRIELRPLEAYSMVADKFVALSDPQMFGIAFALLTIVGAYYWSYIEQFLSSISRAEREQEQISTPSPLAEVGPGLYALAVELPTKPENDCAIAEKAQATNFNQQEYDRAFDAAVSRCQKLLAVTQASDWTTQLTQPDGQWNHVDLPTTDTLMALEEALHEKSQQLSVAETAHLNLYGRVQELEEQSIKAKNLLLQAKSEVRKNLEARSKDLHTAHKAMLFSRRSLAARTRAENEVKQIRSQLDEQRTANTKLQAALGEQKRKPLIKSGLEERIAKKKRSATEELLTNRLIKKVAKHRLPLSASLGDHDTIPTLVATVPD